MFHTENGVLGFGEAPPQGEEDWDLINAGKKAVTLKPGAAFFHHADSFAMVRGGHLDVAILGAYEVAENGDLANWRRDLRAFPAVGGAMDLVHGARRVAVITDHVTKDGKSKLVQRCTLPLTGVGCVTRAYTSLAVLDIARGRFVLREKLPALTFDELQAATGAKLYVEGAVADLVVPRCDMAEVFICDYIRTPIGRFGGAWPQSPRRRSGGGPRCAARAASGSSR